MTRYRRVTVRRKDLKVGNILVEESSYAGNRFYRFYRMIKGNSEKAVLDVLVVEYDYKHIMNDWPYGCPWTIYEKKVRRITDEVTATIVIRNGIVCRSDRDVKENKPIWESFQLYDPKNSYMRIVHCSYNLYPFTVPSICEDRDVKDPLISNWNTLNMDHNEYYDKRTDSDYDNRTDYQSNGVFEITI